MGTVLKVKEFPELAPAKSEPSERVTLHPQEEESRIRNILETFRALGRGIFWTMRLSWCIVRAAISYGIRHPFTAAFNALISVILVLVVITGSSIHEQMILGKISDHTVD